MPTLRSIHLAAAALAATLVATFWGSTALTLWRFPEAYGAVHHGILWGIPVLIAAAATAGITGRKLAGPRSDRPVRRKRLLSALLALNGLALLLPCALILREAPPRGLLPAVELLAGGLQLGLLFALARTGRTLSRRHEPAARQLA